MSRALRDRRTVTLVLDSMPGTGKTTLFDTVLRPAIEAAGGTIEICTEFGDHAWTVTMPTQAQQA